MLRYDKIILQAITGSEAVKQSALVAAGNIGTSVLLGIAMLLASRSLGPEKFGILSVSMAIMAVVARIVDSGTNQLIPKFINLWHEDSILEKEFLGQIVKWKLVLTTITLFCSVFFVPVIASTLNYPYISLILWAVFGGIFMGLYEHISLVLSAHHDFKSGVVLSFIQAIVKCLGFLGLYLIATDWVIGYAAVYYIAPLVASVWAIYYFSNDFLIAPRSSRESIKPEVFAFWKHSALGVLAITLIYNLDILMVQRSLSPFDAGVYSAASRIAVLLSFTIAAMGGVLNNRVARYKDKHTLRKYLRKSLLLVAAAIIGFLVFLPFSRVILIYSVGTEYLEGLSSLIILSANAFVTMALVPYIAIFYALDRPKYFSFGYWVQVLVIVLGNLLFLSDYGVLAAAVTRLIATMVYAVFTIMYLRYAWKRLEL